jgi:hypothetical protein
MNRITTAVGALALSAIMTAGATAPAKADGGAVAIGVGVYLLTDAIVGRKCHREDWPFNIVAKIADEIHGRDGCDRYGYRDHDYDSDDRGHHGRKYR